MSAPAGSGDVREIDRICDQFEAACKSGGSPRLEDYVGRGAPLLRRDLLRHLLDLEREYRSLRGEHPEAAEYRPRFPAEADVVEAAFADPAPTLPTPAEKLLKLTATEGPHQGQVFTLAGHQLFLVGRALEAQLQLAAEDRLASRNHFLIEFNPPNCRLTDLGSRTGTFVNGERVSAAEVRDGDVIRAGRTALAVALAVVNPAALSATDVTLGPDDNLPALPAEPRPATDLYRTVGTAKSPGPSRCRRLPTCRASTATTSSGSWAAAGWASSIWQRARPTVRGWP
jgi:FHA domain-containing protein